MIPSDSPSSPPPKGAETSGTQPAPSPQLRAQTDRVLWLALLFSHGLYAFLLQAVLPLPADGAGASDMASLQVIFLAMALGTAGAALVLDATRLSEGAIDRLIDAQSASDRTANKSAASLANAVADRIFVSSILRSALAEATSIMGLVAAMIGAVPRSRALLFVAVGVAVHLYCRPKLQAALDRLAARTPPGASR